jgi:O-antigen ligase
VPVQETSERPAESADLGAARGGGAALRWLRETPELFPALAAVALFLIWTGSDAGILPTDWYPGAVFLLGLLAVTAYGFRRELPGLPRVVVIALALLAGFTLWSFLSITWADDQGSAWDGANRSLLYLTVFAVFALPPWRPRAAALVLGLYAIALAVFGAIVVINAASSANPLDYFVANRFAEPTGYHNANAALFTAAIFPAIFLASRRETHWLARGALLASAGVLFQLALMPQSRGWLVTVPLAAIAYFVLVPGRTRSLIALLPVAIVAALTVDPILDVFDAFEFTGDTSAVPPALDRARDAILVSAGVLFVVGAVFGFVDRRIEVSDRTGRVGSRVAAALSGAAVLCGIVIAIAAIGNPVTWAGDRWEDFKSGQSETPQEGSRLGKALGSNRYDFWRVAADEFTSSPLGGVGSNNFAHDYLRDRESDEEPAYSHNFPLSVLSETGLVGAGLFLGFLAAALTAIARVRLRSQDLLARGVAAIAAVVFIYWFLHSTGDWFWPLPAVSAPVLAWLGMGTRLGADRRRSPEARSLRQLGWPVAAAGVVGVVLAISLVLPWRAAVDVKKAGESWAADPQAAFDRLDRARGLNFLSANPDMVEGAIAVKLGDQERARVAYERALERDPRNWYASLELAALAALGGDTAASLERLDRVAELNPREPVTEQIRRGVLSGSPVSLGKLDDIFLERYCRVHGQVLGPDGCETP